MLSLARLGCLISLYAINENKDNSFSLLCVILYNAQALVETNDREIYTSLTCGYSGKYDKEKGVVGTQLLGERAKIILDEVRDLELLTHSQCLEHIGTFYICFCFLVYLHTIFEMGSCHIYFSTNN